MHGYKATPSPRQAGRLEPDPTCARPAPPQPGPNTRYSLPTTNVSLRRSSHRLATRSHSGAHARMRSDELALDFELAPGVSHSRLIPFAQMANARSPPCPCPRGSARAPSRPFTVSWFTARGGGIRSGLRLPSQSAPPSRPANQPGQQQAWHFCSSLSRISRSSAQLPSPSSHQKGAWRNDRLRQSHCPLPLPGRNLHGGTDVATALIPTATPSPGGVNR
jgi:hypothetical protein